MDRLSTLAAVLPPLLLRAVRLLHVRHLAPFRREDAWLALASLGINQRQTDELLARLRADEVLFHGAVPVPRDGDEYASPEDARYAWATDDPAAAIVRR